MVYFRVVILFLSSFSREEDLCHALASQRVNQFAVVVKGTIIQYALNEQFITDVLLLCLWCVPKEALVLVYDLFA